MFAAFWKKNTFKINHFSFWWKVMLSVSYNTSKFFSPSVTRALLWETVLFALQTTPTLVFINFRTILWQNKDPDESYPIVSRNLESKFKSKLMLNIL